MKRISIIVVLALTSVCSAFAQTRELKTVYSEDLHFIAFFPDQPKQSEGEIDTRYGKAFSRRWLLELPDISYEVAVLDLRETSVKMDRKSLSVFYDSVCKNTADQYGVAYDSGYSDELFGEYGRTAGPRNKEVIVDVRMFLIRKRLYVIKVVMRRSFEADERTIKDVKSFFDWFVFVQKKENEKKFIYGLPKSLSQNLEGK